MAGIKKASFKEQVYKVIKEKILHQEFALGQKLNIDALAATLNVSNSPVREALTTLERDGLVTMAPNDGARVISFTEESYVEISRTIYVMLAGAYQLCIDLGTTKQLAAIMEKHLKEQKKRQKSGNYHELVEAAILFDKSIIKATQNNYLLSNYERIEAVFYLMILYNYQQSADDPIRNLNEHELILSSITEGNHEEVRKRLAIHYDKHIKK